MRVRLYYILIWQNGKWRSLDSLTQHFEADAKDMVSQWKRSGFKAKMSLAGTLETR